MTNKLYMKIKKILKENKWDILVMIIMVLSVTIEFPYYINAPGGIEPLDKKVIIENEHESEGSFNQVFVSEYKANAIMLLFSYLNPNFDIYKNDEYLAINETYETMNYRNVLEMEEANDNATIVAYQKANENIEINKTDIYVTYVFPEAITDIEVKDELISINGITFNNKEELDNVIDNFDVGEKVSVKVINDGKEYEREATIQCEDEDKYIGLYITQDIDYDVERNIEFKVADNESGPSGGLMMALEIYNELTREDLTKGYTIAGTGTIDTNGEVGSISGVKYKLKSAVQKKVKIFFIPAGENYDEAIELKQKYNYEIDIIPVENIEDALSYLATL